MSPWGLYVHVPFCRIRCPYCAFHVDPDHRADHTAFVDAALHEYALRRPAFEGPPHTVYLGGGTPSRLPDAQLRRLLAGLHAADAAEITVEVNPEDLTPGSLTALLDAGVTRISLGAQTLSPQHARRLGRAHTPADTLRAVGLLQAAPLRSWSLDLMFGLHAQTLDDLHADIDAYLALDPPHISLYGLTIEEDTGYARAVARGLLTPSDEERWRDMYTALVTRLGAAGIHRYEVSNFAREGHRSEHNQGYWAGRPYLGIGPSAHGLGQDGQRWANVADTVAWQADPLGTATVEDPSAHDVAVERIVSGLRAVAGLALADLHAASSFTVAPHAIHRLSTGGLLRETDGLLALTDEGFYVADAVVRALADALVPVDPDATSR